VISLSRPLGVAIVGVCSRQKADPSGWMLLVTGAERSEALAAMGVGPRETNQ